MIGEDRTLCVIGGKHEADHGLLCDHHYGDLRKTLGELETEAAILSALPTMQQHNGGRGGEPAFTRAPARVHVLCLVDPRRGELHWAADDFDDTALDDTPSVLETLHSWARTVREDQRLTTPATVTISGERDFLDRHLPWLAYQPYIDEMYDDLRKLLGRLRSANGTSPLRPVAACTQCEDGNVWRSNTWRTVWRVGRDRCERQNIAAPDGPAYCDTCGAKWDDVKRLELAEELARRPRTDDGRPMKTAEEIMRDTGLSRSAFDVRAHRMRKAGIGGMSKKGYYDPADFGKVTA